MWKDFFYYSKSERRAVYLLLSFIVLLLVITFIDIKRDGSDIVVEKGRKVDSILPTGRVPVKDKIIYPKSKKEEKILFTFNPNLADSNELSRLGLSPFVVNNILKYRGKGGRFKTSAAFARIYGLTKEQFAELEPYIQIPQTSQKIDTPITKTVQTKVLKQEKPVSTKYPKGTLVDVNVADTAELKRIPGVGSVIANSIVTYRERLGGFYALEQLLEVRYVTPDLMEWFTIGNTPIKKIGLNKVGFDKLRSHPYINFYQAKVIMDYRKKKGKIKSLSQLALYEEFTEKDLKRLFVYFSFD